MEINNLSTVVFSPCGGTKRVAEAITLKTGLPVKMHDVTLPNRRKESLAFGPHDLVFLCWPVYGGHVPRNTKEIFAKLSGNNTPAVLVAVYGNREYEAALLDMRALALEHGFTPVAACTAIAEHSLAPIVANGRPDAADMDALANFGLQTLEQIRSASAITAIEVPGVIPNWPAPPREAFLIGANNSCTNCGTCATVCPTGAITPSNYTTTDPDACIVCAACMKYCPVKARGFVNLPKTEEPSEHIKIAMSRRKEPEFYL